MKTLNKKLFRDIRKNWTQFLMIFLMVFLGVFCFAGIHSYMDGMAESAKEYYEENNLEDLWLVGDGFVKKDIDRVKNTPTVADAEGVLTINVTLENFDDVTLEANFIDSNNISRFYVTEGSGFDASVHGVWIDSYLAENLGLKVGDEITCSYESYRITEPIAGLIMVPDHVYNIKDDTALFPTHRDYGFIYLSYQELPEEVIYDGLREYLGQTDASYESYSDQQIRDLIPDFDITDYHFANQILVDLKDSSDKTNIQWVKGNLEKRIESATAVLGRETSNSYSMYQSEIDEGKTYSFVLTALFLFIAVLSVVTTMNRFVRRQRLQIGTLKSLGIPRKKIQRHYLSYGLWISLPAAVLGLVIGNFTLGKFFIRSEMEYFEIPAYHTRLGIVVYVLAVLTVLLVMAVVYWSTARILRESAAESIRTEVPKVKDRSFRATTRGPLSRASFSTKWNLRDMARSKGRVLMSAVGIIGCTVLLIAGLGMKNTMADYMDWVFEGLYNFEYKIGLSQSVTQEELQTLEAVYGNATSESPSIEIQLDGERNARTLTVTDAGEKLRFTDKDRNFIQIGDDGVYITAKLASTTGLKAGDTVTWHIMGDDNWITSTIAGLNRDPQNQGMTMSRSFYESLGFTYEPDNLYTDLQVPEDSDSPGIATVTSRSALRDGMNSMMGLMNEVLVILTVIAFLLAVVIIYNMGILSFTEKQYQFATMKVLGFQNRQIRRIFVRQNIWITVCSVVLALPLGYWITDYTFRASVGDEFDFVAVIRISSYLISVAFVIVVSLVVNRILAGKVKKIDMVTSLKGNE